MKKRKGFTLVELLVVIGLILILISLLLPALNHLYSNAQVSQAKLDLNSITSALENYKQDFGDYPRNTFLPTFGGVPANGGYTHLAPANLPPFCLPLAAALIGPGPATSNLVAIAGKGWQSVVPGDGADGPGFRDRSVDFAATVIAGFPTVIGQNTISVASVPSNWDPNPASGNPYALQVTTQIWPLASVVFAPGQSNEETVGLNLQIGAVPTSPSTGPWTLTFNSPLVYLHFANEIVVLRTATGKIWQPYLPAERFKVQWVNRSGQPIEAQANQKDQGQSVLLDRWGTPIQYFVRNGGNTNRTGDSFDFTTPPLPDPSVLVGPLYGISVPHSIVLVGDVNGQNAIWDEGYAVETLDSGGAPEWQHHQPGAPAASTTNDPTLAFRWMLGVEGNNALQGGKTVNNEIRDPDHLRFTGDYILISAGPDAQFCNFIDFKTGACYPTNLLLSKFKASRNVYNFDR